ncbi:uncharacterized protein LOC128993437 [Macrosteles quadrilineatus]|uniref:uncharacterized protein LOC128993437 n=1 Tax=Macrosteles quadrilineatus TaxID=74068 RepID=UPI0023E0EC58|nr:uncharacterized protein LOC128993437 [Macrosteles quadrilineatus]
MAWPLVAFALMLSTSQGVYGIFNTTSIIIHPEGFSIYPCLQVDHREQDIDSALMGLWYVIEIIQHKDEPQNRGTMVSDICPKISLYKTSPKHIKLVWHERAGDVHYTFQLTDPENSGFWITWSLQNGSMLNKSYKQFAGSVQVIDAQPNRMVLTFCSNTNNRTHYSIVMVRNITVHHDTQEIHRSLQNYRLPEVGTRLTCRDPPEPDSASLRLSSAMVVLPATLLLLSRLI